MQKRGIFKFSNKKGTYTIGKMLMHLGMLVLATSIALLFIWAKSIEKDTEFQKIFLSRDVALLVNTLYSLPGKVEYTYSFNKLDLNNFNFEFKPLSTTDDRPIVRVQDNSVGKSYPFGKTLQEQYPYSISGANSLKFSKSDTKLTVTKNE